ncbi:hypothetical protein CDCA_CDCA14G3761 [Cyanidium caldarium]|uniref:PRA1 family protein n=1 Tax=Cyanidium caldarium TaxID=2771 RepID=A0AAV9J021_CYACA|nr:hypothetical protein CDCA_CDCA14G3761 [Cyanidium caldarium]
MATTVAAAAAAAASNNNNKSFSPTRVPNRWVERLMGGASDHLYHWWSSAAPWLTFFDTHQLATPASATEARDRLLHNLVMYRGNYTVIAMGMMTLAALMRPLLLLAGVLVAALYVYLFVVNPAWGMPYVTPRVKQGAVALVALTLVFALDAFSTISSSCMVALLLALAHAASRRTSEEPDFEAAYRSKV